MRFFCSAGTRSHSRMMSGPWLAANAPTRLAIQSPDELIILHAGGEEVIAQEIGVRALGEERHIDPRDRVLDGRLERITRQHLVALGAELGRKRRRLQVEEELGEPVVAHRSGIPARDRSRLPYPPRHLQLVEVVLMDVDPARFLAGASWWNRPQRCAAEESDLDVAGEDMERD